MLLAIAPERANPASVAQPDRVRKMHMGMKEKPGSGGLPELCHGTTAVRRAVQRPRGRESSLTHRLSSRTALDRRGPAPADQIGEVFEGAQLSRVRELTAQDVAEYDVGADQLGAIKERLAAWSGRLQVGTGTEDASAVQ